MNKISVIILALLVSFPVFAGELHIKVGDHPDPRNFKDGDVIHAFTDEQILYTNAQIIARAECPFNEFNLRTPGCLLEFFQSTLYQYKYERLGDNTTKRTDLTTGEEVFTKEPLVKRITGNRHKIFGAPGLEYWYSGNIDWDITKINSVWDHIEANSTHKKADHLNYPFKDHELKKNLRIKVDDMDIDDVRIYTEPKRHPITNKITKKRKHMVDYDSLDITQQQKANVKNKNKRARIDKKFKSKTIVKDRDVVEGITP